MQRLHEEGLVSDGDIFPIFLHRQPGPMTVYKHVSSKPRHPAVHDRDLEQFSTVSWFQQLSYWSPIGLTSLIADSRSSSDAEQTSGDDGRPQSYGISANAPPADWKCISDRSQLLSGVQKRGLRGVSA